MSLDKTRLNLAPEGGLHYWTLVRWGDSCGCLAGTFKCGSQYRTRSWPPKTQNSRAAGV